MAAAISADSSPEHGDANDSGEPERPVEPAKRPSQPDPARPRRPGPVRGRLLLGRLLDLLRARRGRRPRPRTDAADLPRRGPALRPHHPQLRGGRRHVPRARRLLELRPPRLQRAGRLHRRLGDPDRLPDRRCAGGHLGAALPGADLLRPLRAGLGDRRRGAGHRRRLPAQRAQHHRPRPRAATGGPGARRHQPAAGGDRRRGAHRPAPGPAHRPARSLQRPERRRHRLRLGGGDARLRRDRGRFGPGPRHRRPPARPQADRLGRRLRRAAGLRRDGRGGADGGAGRRRAARSPHRARRPTSSRRRCSASSPPSTRTGSPR